MKDQEIIDNAPEGAVSYTEFVEVKLNTYAKKWGGEHVFWDERLKTWTHDGWEQSSSKANFRSLADIKRIVELEASLARSQTFIKCHIEKWKDCIELQPSLQVLAMVLPKEPKP